MSPLEESHSTDGELLDWHLERVARDTGHTKQGQGAHSMA